jgi:hypothetical protein
MGEFRNFRDAGQCGLFRDGVVISAAFGKVPSFVGTSCPDHFSVARRADSPLFISPSRDNLTLAAAVESIPNYGAAPRPLLIS